MRILTALDRSEYAEIVLEHGLDQAAREPTAELHFVSVVPDERETDVAQQWLKGVVHDGLDTFGLAARSVALHVRRGRPAPAIAALARELPADLLVVGRFHVPSEADLLVDIIQCPLLVVGIEGDDLAPQCADCGAVRIASDGELLFCDRHKGDRIDLMSRVPTSTYIASRLW
jgi:nucleotide-binding universal stress UspA family protein